MFFHWSLSDSKSPRVSKTLLRIWADLNNPVVWMVSIRPSIFNSSSSLSKPLVTVPDDPITIGIPVTLMFHGFFLVFNKVFVLVSVYIFLNFQSVVHRSGKVNYTTGVLFFFSFFFF